MSDQPQTTAKKNSFWRALKDFFVISREDLNDWKKKNYESRQQMGYTSREEDEAYDEEWERKNKCQ